MSELENTVREFQSGNQSAFAQLVKRYQGFVISVAYSLIGDIGRSEDVAQQAFVTAWEKQEELKDASRFGGWIRSITRNLARNERRKSVRQNVDTIDAGESEQLSVDEPTPLERTIANEQSEWLWSVLEQIPENYREPMVLYYRDGQPVAQIAAMLEISEDTAKQRLSRGRKAMRDEIALAVEKSLGQQRSSPAFAVGVLSAIGSSAASKATGTVVSGGISAATTGWSMSAILGSLGGLIGAGIGIGGAVYGSRKSLQSATSEQERKLMWKIIGWSIALVSAITFWQLGGAFLFPTIAHHPVAIGIVWSVYAITLVWMIVWGNQRIREIKKVHGTEEERKGEKPTEDKPISFTGMCSNMIGAAFGCWFWLILLAGFAKAWFLMAIAITLFATSSTMGCMLARTRIELVDQLKLTGRFALVTTTLVTVTMLVGWFALEKTVPQFADGHDISPWLLAIFIMAIGIAVSQLNFWRAKKLLNQK